LLLIHKTYTYTFDYSWDYKHIGQFLICLGAPKAKKYLLNTSC